MKDFLLFCSGANTEVLRECPTDVSKYVGIGATIVLTAVLACLSGGYALYTVFLSVPAAVVFGALWGVIIFNLDRVIVSGMRKQKHFVLDLLYAMPRFAISLLLAVVISRPLELKLFAVEIHDRWQQLETERRNRDTEQIEAADGKRLAELRSENERLGAQVEQKRAERDAREQDVIHEREGSAGTGIPGVGSAYLEKDRALAEAERQMKDAEERNQPRIARNEQEIARILAVQKEHVAQADSARAHSEGFLGRMEALGSLADEKPTIYWASIFITLLFISLETAPVMVKLLATLSPYRPYDELLEQREFEIVERTRQNVKVRKHVLKTDAERSMKDLDDEFATEVDLRTRTARLRLDAELRGKEAVIQQVADAQGELAERIVREWKRKEMEKIDEGQVEYA